MEKGLEGSGRSLRYYPIICLGGLGTTMKDSVGIAGVSAEIRTEHQPKTNLGRYL
jgi:hypothetical protein